MTDATDEALAQEAREEADDGMNAMEQRRAAAEATLKAELQDNLMDYLEEDSLFCVERAHVEYPGAFSDADIEKLVERIQEALNDYLNGIPLGTLNPWPHIFKSL